MAHRAHPADLVYSPPVARPTRLLLALALALSLLGSARADEPQVASRTYSRIWPLTLDAHLLIGGEFHGPRGIPIAFGVGGELMWRARIGAFAALLSSEGSPILPQSAGNGKTLASLADRISVPIALAWRPFTPLAEKHVTWPWRLLAGIGVQAGVSIENLRTSDDDATTAGLHLGLSIDVPVFGGPIEGGLALRLYGRMVVAPDVTLDVNQPQRVHEPIFTGQIFGGLTYYL